MKGLVLCNNGIEDIASLDIKEIIGRESKQKQGFVTFEFEKEEELCKLAYISQSISKSILVLDPFKFKSEKEIIQKAKRLKLKKWLSPDKSFKVCALVKEADISQEELKGAVGRAVIESITDYKQKVNLNNPDLILYAFVRKDKAYLGIDFAEIDLSKRSYRIFSNPKNIKSTLAYAMVRISGYKRGDTLIDPFCLSGSIAIEAALFCNKFPVRFFDKNDFIFDKIIKFDFENIDKEASKDKGDIFSIDSLFRNVDAAKKNAKIAGINKAISFSRMEIDWLDTKFDVKSIDRIVTCLPNITKYSNKKEILKIYKEFFHQAEFVLREKGSVVVCTKNPEEVKGAGRAFKVSDEREVWQGKEKLWILKFGK